MEQFGDRAAAKQLRLREAIVRRRVRGARPPLDGDGRPARQAANASGLRHPSDGQHDSRPTEGFSCVSTGAQKGSRAKLFCRCEIEFSFADVTLAKVRFDGKRGQSRAALRGEPPINLSRADYVLQIPGRAWTPPFALSNL
jgi:hypothetical protein